MDEIVRLEIEKEMFDEMTTYEADNPQGARVELVTKVPEAADSILTLKPSDFQNGHVRLEHINDDDFEGYFVRCSNTTLYLKNANRVKLIDWLRRNGVAIGSQLTGM